ncbi:MAG: hypothetical protein JSV07_06665 [Acidimicrobiia bacterium]|jgi:predicted RNA-binding Zn-ribbon protein involved in translation (DUF1610 family)|nr:MAG: hypothetical protein JSV07_06665 [Acidimicrobiia bacterium]
MTTIKTTCPVCGTVELGVHNVLLEVPEGTEQGVYSFVCPSCFELRARAAGRRIVLLLQAAGVEPNAHPGHPITESEIVAFAAAIRSEPAPTRRL